MGCYLGLNSAEDCRNTPCDSCTANEPLPDRPFPGESYRLKDGRTVHIIIAHRPGNGYGVTYSELTVSEFYALPVESHKYQKHADYLPWAKFKKLALARA